MFWGVNGLVSQAESREEIFGSNDVAVLLLVIFTTANLWVYTGDLKYADINTGDLPVNPEHIRPAKWLLFNHNVSSDLAHGVEFEKGRRHSIQDAAIEEDLRTVAVVSREGIGEFLSWSSRQQWRIE